MLIWYLIWKKRKSKLGRKRRGSNLGKERDQPQTKENARVAQQNQKNVKRVNQSSLPLKDYHPLPSPIRLQPIIQPKTKTPTSQTSLPCQLNQPNLRGLISA